jgi:oligopeptide transport system permease protein
MIHHPKSSTDHEWNVAIESWEPSNSHLDNEKLNRPSLSYWQDAWFRLQKNRRALSSLYIILVLLIFTLLGPFVWHQDPYLQDLDMISRGPMFGTSALIVEDPGGWQPPRAQLQDNQSLTTPLGATETLSLPQTANTQYVRLQWESVPTADAYLIYRNNHAPADQYDLGLPLSRITDPTVVGFQDRLQIQPQTYWYTVIAQRNEVESSQLRTIRVEPVRAITLNEAKLRGYEVALDEEIKLPAHPFGTDYLGRDVLARIMNGAQISMFIGVIAPLLFVLIGTLYGGIAGFLGGNIDSVMMRIADFIIALPFLLFMILFRIAFGIGPGESGILPILFALVILRWPDTARLVRGQILQIREEPYVQAARLLGAKNYYIILRHLLPNTLGAILVTLTFAIPMAIFTEAFLSFIGMGVAPGVPSWGSMSNEGIKTMLSSPHELFVPAIFISLTVLAFNMLGDGLRDSLDSRMRSRE